MTGRRLAVVAMSVALVAIVAVALRIYLASRELPDPPAGSGAVASSPSPSPPRSPSPSPSPSPPPVAEPPATDTRKAILDNIRSSGHAHETWDDQGRALFNSLASGDTIVAYEGCYIAGCAATLSFATEDEYKRVRDEAERSDAFRAWTGGKKWSRTDTAEDGRILVALVIYRPD